MDDTPILYIHTHTQKHTAEKFLSMNPGKTRSYNRHDAGEISKLEAVVPLSHPPPTRLRMTAKFFLFFTSGAADSVVHKPLPHVSLTSHWHDRFVNPHTASYIRFSVIYKVRFWKELGNIFHAATHTLSLSFRLHWPTRNTFDCFFFFFCFLVFSMGCVSGSCGLSSFTAALTCVWVDGFARRVRRPTSRQ
jgi:hypothetical protein